MANESGTSHYVTVAPEKVKEQLRPRLEKDEVLIRNIGKMEELKELPTTNTVALCNGFCSKNPITSPCAKANAFLTTTDLISSGCKCSNEPIRPFRTFLFSCKIRRNI